MNRSYELKGLTRNGPQVFFLGGTFQFAIFQFA